MTQRHSLTMEDLTVSMQSLAQNCGMIVIHGASTSPSTVQDHSFAFSGTKRSEDGYQVSAEVAIDAAREQSRLCTHPELYSYPKPPFCSSPSCACHVDRFTVGLADRQDGRMRNRSKAKKTQRLAGSPSNQVGDTRLLSQVCHHLQQLSPHRRREFISQQFTQKQRLALEQWMLRREAEGHGCKRCSMHLCGRPRKTHLRWHDSSPGKLIITTRSCRICVSLCPNFYLQSGLCRSHQERAHVLKMLIGIRNKFHQASSQGLSLKVGLVSCLKDLRQSSRSCARAAEGFRFRAQLSFGRGNRLSSPLRRDPVEALDDWRRLMAAWNYSLFSGSQVRAAYSPDLAEKQWLRSCQAWRDIWIHSGRCPQDLEKSLKAKEAALGPRWVQAKVKWHCLQAKISARIKGLLAIWSRRCGDASSNDMGKPVLASLPTRNSKRRRLDDIVCSSVYDREIIGLQRPAKTIRSLCTNLMANA
eukprot:CAMPEP_0169304520 /NCGR_PEP_ID=MMETSP1016-20121227/69925_1 /TAXON_ID=342587 /ORGANISM="Karlodinium micrum, Strain CCMP2283" /LENGTH=471 /DNA_ID=CAMNT_0009397399 /DNA_START=54 /DNA_END=1469 /DNA_ORIENTATION=+